MNEIIDVLNDKMKVLTTLTAKIEYNILDLSTSAPLNDASFAEKMLERMNINMDLIVDFDCNDDNIDHKSEFIDEDFDIQKLAYEEYRNEYYFNADIFPIFQRIFDKDFGYEKRQYSKYI